MAMNADMEEFETDLWYMEKGLWVEGKARDAELAGKLLKLIIKLVLV